MIIIEQRKRVRVNTDPQRRVYNGCMFSSELVWTPWEVFETLKKDSKGLNCLEKRLLFWRELNQIAVKGRGESAKTEYRGQEKKYDNM